MFSEGDLVDVAGTTIGKGFQGESDRPALSSSSKRSFQQGLPGASVVGRCTCLKRQGDWREVH